MEPSAIEPGATHPESPTARFARWYAAALLYTVAVVLFGAVVRVTKSGAGCGQHWPSCQGEVFHLPSTLASIIEYSHRVTSGSSFVVVLVLAVVAARRFPPGDPARRFALAALGFMVVEVLIGAVLVLFGLVAGNSSVQRAIVGATHLVNTTLLTGAMLLAVFHARFAGRTVLSASRGTRALVLVGAIGLLFVGTSGSVTALGDTLYPVKSGLGAIERLVQDQSATAHFLARLRIGHPVLASFTAAYLLGVASTLAAGTRQSALWLIALVSAQVACGIVNIWLHAPAWLQIVHLALANAVWLAFVWLAAHALWQPETNAERIP